MSRSQLKNSIPTRIPTPTQQSHTIKGRVYSVILDENHFFFRKVLKDEFDPSYIGWVYWGNLNLKLGGTKEEDILKYCILAKPYFNFITYPPLVTEIVELVKAPSNKHYASLGGSSTNVEYFYFPPVNVWNNSSYNTLPSEQDIQINNGEVNFGEYIKENQLSSVTTMLPFEGDMILEGRFGNSIRFGSSTPRGKNNWSENNSEGDPIIIISNGQESSGYTPIENINKDASSIYLTSNQNIHNFGLACNNFSSLGVEFKGASSGLSPIQNFSLTTPSGIINGNSSNTDNFGGGGSRESDDSGIDGGEDGGVDIGDVPGFEDLVALPGTYKDNNNTPQKLYYLPKKNGGKILPEKAAKSFLIMAADAAKEGVTLIVDSGFRPPMDDIYIIDPDDPTKKKFVQSSQKTVRLQHLKSQFKNKLKEPWFKSTTCISPFTGPDGVSYNVGDKVSGVNSTGWFTPATAPAYRSPHGYSIALDIRSKGGTTETFKWMCFNSWKYGWIRTVKSETWHFDYKPDKAYKGATAELKYKYNGNRDNSKNEWKDIFGPNEPNWAVELQKFQEKKAIEAAAQMAAEQASLNQSDEDLAANIDGGTQISGSNQIT